tara:strand:+ start:97 stop:312 length:216 start_codon:yes stop_codon:yes gene_type:complete
LEQVVQEVQIVAEEIMVTLHFFQPLHQQEEEVVEIEVQLLNQQEIQEDQVEVEVELLVVLLFQVVTEIVHQ